MLAMLSLSGSAAVFVLIGWVLLDSMPNVELSVRLRGVFLPAMGIFIASVALLLTAPRKGMPFYVARFALLLAAVALFAALVLMIAYA
jgi:hypothetical protein